MVPIPACVDSLKSLSRSLWVHRPSWMWTVIPDHRDSSPSARNTPIHSLEHRGSEIYHAVLRCKRSKLIAQFSVPSSRALPSLWLTMRLQFGRYLSHLLGFPAFHTFAFVSIAAVIDCDIGGSCDWWCLEKLLHTWQSLHVVTYSIPSGEDSLSFQLTIDLSGWPSSGSMGSGIFGSSVSQIVAALLGACAGYYSFECKVLLW
ncbi:hypothetical protein BU17DRAFT_60816 [Hysterangium stoloniferum]|nr:hypothetical protein BU17DRAFT_60816 [Hysterangium stoloniferum]